MKRRNFIKGLAGISAAAAMTGLYTWQIEPFWLEFVERKMNLYNLPNPLKGKTLMQISDLHVGNRFDYGYLIDSLKEAKKFKPDYVVYTGDFVSYEDGEQYSQLEEVLQNVVKGRTGTIGILGNHDYGKNWAQPEVADRIVDICEDSGITMLRNQTTTVGGLQFLGIDDLWAINFHPEKAMKNYNPALPAVALCHNPDVCDMDVWGDFKGWILSGHTHGGQCKPPFLPPPMLPVKNEKYASGHVQLQKDRHVYINRALGHLWQVRFNVRPEITIFELG